MEENAYLILGCYGRIENGFILCSTTQNRILKLDDSLVNLDGVIKYLDVIKLFDRPILDQNAVRHLVYNLQERFDQKFKRMWTDHEYHLLERFMQMHKPCGIYAQLVLVQEEDNTPPQVGEDISFVRGITEIHRKERKTTTDLIRNRKY